jgi:Cysteine-rich secretory protein family
MKKINLRRVFLTAACASSLFAGLLCWLPRVAYAQHPASTANVSEEYLKSAADQERAAFGLAPLRLDAGLSNAARRHAALMVEHNSISHQYAREPDLAHRASEAGARFSLITENVAQAPSAIRVHTAWMHSEGHRHNLLDPNVDSVGISVIERNGQMFAVEDFARSVASLSVRQQEGVVAASVRASGVTVDGTGEDARQVCAGGQSAAIALPPEFVMRYTTDDLERLPDELTTRLQSGRYGRAIVAACALEGKQEFSMYRVAVLLYRGDRDGR